jgi:hypothetical protein
MYVFQDYYHRFFQDLKLSGARVAPDSHVSTSIILLLLFLTILIISVFPLWTHSFWFNISYILTLCFICLHFCNCNCNFYNF